MREKLLSNAELTGITGIMSLETRVKFNFGSEHTMNVISRDKRFRTLE